jgi:hypothetical protein
MVIKVLAFITHEVIEKWRAAYESIDPKIHIPQDESVAGFNSAIVVDKALKPADAGLDFEMPFDGVAQEDLPGMLRDDYRGPLIGFVRSQDDILITAEDE